MSIFNPWGELRAIKARLAAEEEAYLIEEAQQQADWAKKDALLGELDRKNATLRRANEKLRGQLKTADKRIDYLEKLAAKNSNLYAQETHRSAKIAKTLKEQDELVIMLHEKLAASIQRDPKTGRLLPRKGK
jgi:paraquat-inducible protein B